MGGHSWLISALVLIHMMLVVLFWLWLFYRQTRNNGKGRRHPRQKATEMHIRYGWTEDGEKERHL